jgi:hypothetical protein
MQALREIVRPIVDRLGDLEDLGARLSAEPPIGVKRLRDCSDRDAGEPGDVVDGSGSWREIALAGWRVIGRMFGLVNTHLGLAIVLFDHGIAVFMCNATDDPARERRHIAQLLGKRVDGLVVTARRADRRAPIEPAARGVPVVYVFSQVENPDALCLLPDDEGGARLAVSHLAALGRRKIAHITGPERFEAVRLREIGWRKGLAEAGLKAGASDCRPGQWSEAWGRKAAQTLFSRRRAMPDALFCGNDQIARGAVDALREMGLAVPNDVAVVGFRQLGRDGGGGAPGAHQRRYEP